MSINDAEIFPGKVLLFGEYTILLGGAALTFPLANKTGYFAFPDIGYLPLKAKQSNNVLTSFFDYLIALTPDFDALRMTADLQNSIWFCSSIPSGYGNGSSGALVAATLQRYCLSLPQEIGRMKSFLATMEHFFHGNSSGIDPLTSYMKVPLYSNGEKISPVKIPDGNLNSLFLVDTGSPALTQGLVNLFLEALKDNKFRTAIENEYIPLLGKIIEQLLEGDLDDQPFFRLSTLQLLLFKAMIPTPMVHLWQEGLASKHYFLKLCGSGGGGYLLCYLPKGYLHTGLPFSVIPLQKRGNQGVEKAQSML